MHTFTHDCQTDHCFVDTNSCALYNTTIKLFLQPAPSCYREPFYTIQSKFIFFRKTTASSLSNLPSPKFKLSDVNVKALMYAKALFILLSIPFLTNAGIVVCNASKNISSPIPGPVFTPKRIDEAKFIEALKAICPKSAQEPCVDDPKTKGQCRTAANAAGPILRSFEKYEIINKNEMAALVSLMALESVEFKYQRNVYPGRPGQGSKYSFYHFLTTKSHSQCIPPSFHIVLNVIDCNSLFLHPQHATCKCPITTYSMHSPSSASARKCDPPPTYPLFSTSYSARTSTTLAPQHGFSHLNAGGTCVEACRRGRRRGGKSISRVA